jgi:hypothetical protein
MADSSWLVGVPMPGYLVTMGAMILTVMLAHCAMREDHDYTGCRNNPNAPKDCDFWHYVEFRNSGLKWGR